MEAVRLLLLHGADANARSSDQDTPLHAAAKSGTEDTVRALLEQGACKDAANAMGNVPEKLAVMFAKTSIAKLLHDYSDSVATLDNKIHAPPSAAAVGAAAKGQAGNKAQVSIGMSTHTGDLAAGGGGGRVLQPRKWIGVSGSEVGGKGQQNGSGQVAWPLQAFGWRRSQAPLLANVPAGQSWHDFWPGSDTSPRKQPSHAVLPGPTCCAETVPEPSSRTGR